MIAELQTGLDTDERTFLLSLARNEADFALLGIEHLGQLPGEPLPEPCSERHSSSSVRTLFEQIQLISRKGLNIIGDGFVK